MAAAQFNLSIYLLLRAAGIPLHDRRLASLDSLAFAELEDHLEVFCRPLHGRYHTCKSYAVHVMLLGVQERGNAPVLFLPRPVAMRPGTRPVSETRKQIDDSALLKKIRRTAASAAYSDGNKNWRAAAKDLGLEHHYVTHQVKTFCKRVKPGSVLLSCVAGTQVLDRSWQSLKTFLPPKLSAKLKVDGDSALNPAVKQQLFMWNWRASLGLCTPIQFLDALESLL